MIIGAAARAPWESGKIGDWRLSSESRLRQKTKAGVHAAGWSRRKTCLRLIIGDFSPSFGPIIKTSNYQ